MNNNLIPDIIKAIKKINDEKAYLKDEFEYPQDGWYWFETEDEAKNFFGL